MGFCYNINCHSSIGVIFIFLGIYNGNSIPGKLIHKIMQIPKYLKEYEKGELKVTGFEVKNKFRNLERLKERKINGFLFHSEKLDKEVSFLTQDLMVI